LNIPAPLCDKLLRAGHTILDVGDIKLHLESNKITRIISLDGKAVAEPEFPTSEIDWDIVAEAVT
jgi:hypothetical protein